MDTRLFYKEPLHNYRSRYYNSNLLSIFGEDVDLDVGVDVGVDEDGDLDEDEDGDLDEDFLFFY
jgi:hypothetical protein